MSNIILPEGEGKGLSRRQFLGASGALAGAAALFGVAGMGRMTGGQVAGIRLAQAAELKTDLDIVQFALTLEHLEDAAYRAANASGLLSGKVAEYFKTFGEHEHTHVLAVTDVVKKLGGTPVAEQAKYNLPKFSSQMELVTFFAQVEEVGAGAYLGAAPLIQSKDILAAAAAIHNVEAQHASVFAAVLNSPAPSPAFGKPLTVDQVLAAVTPLLDANAAPAGKYYTVANPAPSIAVAGMAVDSVASTADLAYFAETKHAVAGQFLTFWKQNGGLATYGYPITEAYSGPSPTDGKTYVQQYFQRARFEFHPEHAGTRFEVQLGLLGAEQLLRDMMGGH
ncbi:MAG: ferritin-like domain-containing protein [Chloroflexota bacterium]|nr:ferritin-like domain-containing protein [Chloroflexota bacterium]